MPSGSAPELSKPNLAPIAALPTHIVTVSSKRRREDFTTADTAMDMVDKYAEGRISQARKVDTKCGVDLERSIDRSVFAENQRAVGAAETERVLDRDVYSHRTRRVGAIVQVTGRILIEDVDGRR